MSSKLGVKMSYRSHATHKICSHLSQSQNIPLYKHLKHQLPIDPLYKYLDDMYGEKPIGKVHPATNFLNSITHITNK
jgi:hypothetical protein